MIHQAVFDTSEICHSLGVRHAVISPGSRNAPLIISFSRNEKIEKRIIPDERSAGFIALGIAQKTKQPVVLCCTSGTALLNYAPAIAEAFYREIPLIVLSADRPPELIDQRDGQTIRQFEVLKNHVKASVQLPVIETEDDNANYQASLKESVKKAIDGPAGPVHINIPFREPFYPDKEQKLRFSDIPTEPVEIPVETNLPLPDLKLSGKKVLILVGQQPSNEELNKELNKLSTLVPVLTSPLNNIEVDGINHADLFIKDKPHLRPDVLITAGLSVLSKQLKIFLRKHKPETHLHFDPSGVEVDTFETKPTLIKANLRSFTERYELDAVDKDYINEWKKYSQVTCEALDSYLGKADFSEVSAFGSVLTSLPSHIDLHLSNSMPVRYVDLFGLKQTGIETWSNRGTSGIDGCTSTSIGTSFVSDRLSVLLTGDLSFLYDRNAFFHNYTANNLRVVVFNNSGGGIFRLIEGPRNLPELEEYFEARHNRTAEYICRENEIEYAQARNCAETANGLEQFFEQSERPKVLEIFTDPTVNEKIYNQLKSYINEQVNLRVEADKSI